MAINTLKELYHRDLRRLKSEIELYKNEERIWIVENKIANSAGNLCLHLIGNLNTYIGSVYGNTGYTRNRDLEFSQKNVSKTELIDKIEKTISVIDLSMGNLREEDLKSEYPILVFEEKTSVEYFLIHLATHLNYHLGQINYHRRLLDAHSS